MKGILICGFVVLVLGLILVAVVAQDAPMGVGVILVAAVVVLVAVGRGV